MRLTRVLLSTLGFALIVGTVAYAATVATRLAHGCVPNHAVVAAR